MDAPEGRARVSARITIQVSDHLRTDLVRLAEDGYGGNLQGLIRETLRERVDGGRKETELVQQVLKEVQEIDRGITRRQQDLRDTVLQMLEYARRLEESAGVQHTDVEELSESWLELKGVLVNQAQLIEKLVARVETQSDTLMGLTGHIERQGEAVEQLAEGAANKPDGKLRKFLGL